VRCLVNPVVRLVLHRTGRHLADEGRAVGHRDLGVHGGHDGVMALRRGRRASRCSDWHRRTGRTRLHVMWSERFMPPRCQLDQTAQFAARPETTEPVDPAVRPADSSVLGATKYPARRFSGHTGPYAGFASIWGSRVGGGPLRATRAACAARDSRVGRFRAG
jgi:hypothetical protein